MNFMLLIIFYGGVNELVNLKLMIYLWRNIFVNEVEFIC